MTSVTGRDATDIPSDEHRPTSDDHNPPRPPSRPARYAWVVLAIVFLAGVIAAISQYKVQPLVPVMMDAFGIDMPAASRLMSIFAITGFILALPAGYVLQRLGPRLAGGIAIAAVGLGGLIGVLASTYPVMLVGRAVQGIGIGLIAVVAPTVIAQWFPPEHRGIPMGIWSVWVPAGALIAFNGAPALADAGGWQLVWWITIALCAVAFVAYIAIVRSNGDAGPGPQPAGAPLMSHWEVMRVGLRNGSIWLLAWAYGIYCLTSSGLTGFYTTFLTEERAYTLPAAGFVLSLMMLIGLFAGPLGGHLSDRLGTRRVIYTVATIVIAALWALPFVVEGWQIPTFTLVFGLVSGVFTAVAMTAVPEVMRDPMLIGMGMAVFALLGNLGFVLGPEIFSRLVESIGWANAGLVWIPLLLIGAIAGWRVKVR